MCIPNLLWCISEIIKYIFQDISPEYFKSDNRFFCDITGMIKVYFDLSYCIWMFLILSTCK